MLEAVGHPFAVNPDRALRREAIARGWPVLTFMRPVALRRRLPQVRMPTRSLAAVALVAGTATAALIWLAGHRRANDEGADRIATG